jgi:deazaflavin-dependent oxidoreductase (nitroreductase family)
MTKGIHMDKPYHQQTTGVMHYPTRGTTNRLLFKTPLVLWRLGMGPVLGKQMLVLTTTGRVSKLPRYTMLSYSVHAGSYYILSGWGPKADWYQNIQTDPLVSVQTDKVTTPAAARRVESLEEYKLVMQSLLDGGGDSHFEPWLASLDIQESIDDLIAKRERVYLVALDPFTSQGPEPLSADLTWIWGVAALAFATGLMIAKVRRNR